MVGYTQIRHVAKYVHRVYLDHMIVISSFLSDFEGVLYGMSSTLLFLIFYFHLILVTRAFLKVCPLLPLPPKSSRIL